MVEDYQSDQSILTSNNNALVQTRMIGSSHFGNRWLRQLIVTSFMNEPVDMSAMPHDAWLCPSIQSTTKFEEFQISYLVAR